MWFAIGIITGLLIAILLIVILTYFHRVIEMKTTVIQKNIENKGPGPKGFVFDPPSEADEAREDIIAKNKKLGKDTPIDELR